MTDQLCDLLKEFKKVRNINSDYLILWGTTEKGEYLMLRTTVNSIKESVNTSNTFMMYIIIIGALIGSICIYLLSRRLTNPILDLAEISAKMTNLELKILLFLVLFKKFRGKIFCPYSISVLFFY